MQIEADTEIMQTEFGSQASLKSREVMRPPDMLRLGKTRLAKIIGHNVQCSQEGIQIHHQLAPFLENWFDKLTVRPGYLAFQVLSISHQTFKAT